MPVSRREVIIKALGGAAAACALPALAQPAEETHPLDAVAAYMVPLDDFPEEMAATLAKILQADLKLRIKGSLRLPPLDIPILPGTNQAIAESLLELAAPASAAWAEPGSHRVFLTMRDINARSGNFRYQFSMHAPELRCSVVSLARLLEYDSGAPHMSQRSALRLHKLVKRAIGELQLGWQRSTDPDDLMYAPLTGLPDIDRIGLRHRPKQRPATSA